MAHFGQKQPVFAVFKPSDQSKSESFQAVLGGS